MAGDEKSENRPPKKGRLNTLLASSDKVLIRSRLAIFRAMSFITLTRILRSRIKLGCRIITPTVLLLVLLGLAFFEKAKDNTQLNLLHNLTDVQTQFTKGVCLYQGGAGKLNISRKTCASVFDSNQSASAENYLALKLPEDADLYTYLRGTELLDLLKSFCESKMESSNCPIVFSNAWTKSVWNFNRTVSIGAFSTTEKFNSSAIASVTVNAYFKLLKYFLADDITKGKVKSDAFSISLKSIYEFRGTFIPLYCTFVQIAIICLIPATFLDDLIEDKETMVRTQLTSVGMRMLEYWIMIFFVHYIQYAIIYIISVILLVSIVYTGYASVIYLLGIVLPTLLLGLSNNQLTVYILSSLLIKSNPLFTVAYFFFSIFLVIVILTAQVNNVLGIILIAIVPPVASIALTFYGTKAVFYTIAFFGADYSRVTSRSLRTIFFNQPHILTAFIAVFVHGVLLPLTLGIIENRELIIQLISPLEKVAQLDGPNEHEDSVVREEISKLEEAPRNEQNMLEIRHLRMQFSIGTRVLRDVTFATSPGEIFGLLGPNGAGKSTTMAIMVGELRASAGRCEVRCGETWFSSVLAARKGYIGYCPQFNPLYPNVSVREHLEFYAKVIGMTSIDADNKIRTLLRTLELDKIEGKRSCELSFGFKRRLSLAAALLGDPCLLVIDEASTGVDPEGKRILWQLIRDVSVIRSDRSVVIATNSMEEAESLCTRIGVINLGLLVGLGSVQQVKDRYGNSYFLEIVMSLTPNDTTDTVRVRRTQITHMVLERFSQASVKDEFFNTVSFTIPHSEIGRLSQALAWLMEIKQRVQIAFFTFNQMSLDHVFTRLISMHSAQMQRTRSSSLISLGSRNSRETGSEISADTLQGSKST